MNYSKLSSQEDEFTVQVDDSDSRQSISFSRNRERVGETQVPISRPPSKSRDRQYIVLFIICITIVGLFSLLEKRNITNTLLQAAKVGTWSSMIMISTVLGSFLGSLSIFLLSTSETRSFILSSSVPLSIIIQICLGNLFLFFGHEFFFVGILLFLNAYWCSTYYKKARDTLNFSTAIIEFVSEICNQYGVIIPIFCASLVFFQSCILLGWGVYLISILAEISTKYVILLILCMFFSFYWITKIFHTLIGFIIGACIIWYFIREENDVFQPRQRLQLYITCAFSTSLGSILKGALFAGVSDQVMAILLWSQNVPYHMNNLTNNTMSIQEEGTNQYPLASLDTHRSIGTDYTESYVNHTNGNMNQNTLSHRSSSSSFMSCIKRLIYNCIPSSLNVFVRKHTRLSYYLSAIFGQTLSKSGEYYSQYYSHTYELAIHDISRFNITCIAVTFAGIITIIFGLLSLTETNGLYTEGLFLVLIYYLSYSGLSLCVETYKASLDGLLIAYAIKPERLAGENQIIFLRYLRATDPTLR